MKMNKISFFSLILLSTASYASDEEGFYTCIPCPAGTYLSGNECKLCPMGTFSRGGSSSCESCPPGQYSGVTGAMDNRDCKRCPAGHACKDGQIKICSDGTWAPAGSTACYDCGKFVLFARNDMSTAHTMEWDDHRYNQLDYCDWSTHTGGDGCYTDCYMRTPVFSSATGNGFAQVGGDGKTLRFSIRSTKNDAGCWWAAGNPKNDRVYFWASCDRETGVRTITFDGYYEAKVFP